MSIGWARSPQGHRLLRKSVPDGSCDFQRALDHFLSASDSGDSEDSDGGDYCAGNVAEDGIDTERNAKGRNKKRSTKNKYIVDTEREEDVATVDYDDDFEDNDDESSGGGDTDIQDGLIKSKRSSKTGHLTEDFESGNNSCHNKESSSDYNNNKSNIYTNDQRYTCTCGLYLDSGLQNIKHAWDGPERESVLSPSGLALSVQDSDLIVGSGIHIERKDSPPLKLPSITAHLSSPPPIYCSSPDPREEVDMGINCSTNMHDTREFSGVLAEGQVSASGISKPSKLGNFITKRRSNSESSSHTSSLSPSGDLSTSPEHCSCSSHGDGKKHAGQYSKVETSKGLSSKVSQFSGQKNISKRSSSLPGKSSSKAERSPPQRLLTSRNRSPNGYLRPSGSLDAAGDMRARSHSWSNGRSISQVRPGPIRPITKNSSLFPRSLAGSPPGVHHSQAASETTVVALKNHGNSLVTSSLDSSLSRSIKPGAHSPNCPLYGKPTDIASPGSKRPSLNITLAEAASKSASCDADLDLPPLQRPRAASESHTTRRVRQQHDMLDLPRPRSSTVSEGGGGNSPSSDLVHGAHVHWADEEKGLSLSTSVLLTSIRPRSYSHGAVDGRPHRPILKKVAGL